MEQVSTWYCHISASKIIFYVQFSCLAFVLLTLNVYYV